MSPVSSSTSASAVIREALAAGEGIVRLAPCWVPRSFLMPGGRLKLDPRDLYILGPHRGGIDERWFSSTTKAANGPFTAADEGLSYIEFQGRKVLLKEAIEIEGDLFLGADVMRQYGLIFTQGFGAFGKHRVETPSLIRYGQMTSDELFCSAAAAAEGVRLTNRSATENLVLLKHFGPGNSQAPLTKIP
jgi:hypothetical protein